MMVTPGLTRLQKWANCSAKQFQHKSGTSNYVHGQSRQAQAGYLKTPLHTVTKLRCVSTETWADSSSQFATVSALLQRTRWLLASPRTAVQAVQISQQSRQTRLAPVLPAAGIQRTAQPHAVHNSGTGAGGQQEQPGCQLDGPAFWIVRDDLLRPGIEGNKARKLDALVPELLAAGVSDVVTCGGIQSAHLSAVAAVAAENGVRSHLLVRGEAPAIPTGHLLLARMFASSLTFVARSEYADRSAMLLRHQRRLQLERPGAQVVIIPEGAGDASALLGVVRLVHYLACADSGLPEPLTTPYVFVIDSGTGTTAIGFALGIALLHLPWSVQAVMLAGKPDDFVASQARLVSDFCRRYLPSDMAYVKELCAALPLRWTTRERTRRFGKVYAEDVVACREIAQQHGILLDPIYSLAAWEFCIALVNRNSRSASNLEATTITADTNTAALSTSSRQSQCVHTEQQTKVVTGSYNSQTDVQLSMCVPVVMLHGGGAMGLHGLAQMMPNVF